MNEIQRKRLEWMARNPKGEMFPTELGFDPGAWGEPVADAVKAALDIIDTQKAEIDRLRGKAGQ